MQKNNKKYKLHVSFHTDDENTDIAREFPFKWWTVNNSQIDATIHTFMDVDSYDEARDKILEHFGDAAFVFSDCFFKEKIKDSVISRKYGDFKDNMGIPWITPFREYNHRVGDIVIEKDSKLKRRYKVEKIFCCEDDNIGLLFFSMKDLVTKKISTVTKEFFINTFDYGDD